jgi:ribosomal protein S18 acetylase RimI-like enzyme
MSRLQVIRSGSERLRTGAWRGDASVAFVSPVWESPAPSAGLVERSLQTLRSQGYTEVVTGALSPTEQAGFLEAGFAVRERLHLLSHHLEGLEPLPRPTRLRRARRGDRAEVLRIDGLAFPPFWRLDDAGLQEALDATPTSRFRIAYRGELVGYSVAGRAGRRGYLQRLAVHPDHHRRGTGRLLVLDALHWMRRRGARSAVVNTQVGNEGAKALYEHLGFRLEPEGLAVLTRSLVEAGQ